MAYVDLNPMRAQMGEFPESDPFTSLHQRAAAVSPEHVDVSKVHSGLLHIDTHGGNERDHILPLNTVEYLELIDLAARQVRPDKHGKLAHTARPVLERLGIRKAAWLELELRFSNHFHVLVGRSTSLKNACEILGQTCAWGQGHCKNFFDEPSASPP